MSRLFDWAERLAAYIRARNATPFRYGHHDCVLFAAGAYTAVTGEALEIPHWSTRREAEALLSVAGGLQAAVDGVLHRRPLGFARRGDIALCDTPDGHALFVVLGDNLIGPGPTGLVHWRRAEARCAWAVG